MFAAFALTQQRMSILPHLFHYIIPYILNFLSIRGYVKCLAYMRSQMPALMPPGFFELFCRRSDGNNHHRFSIPEIGVCDTGIHFAGAHILICSTKHFPIASNAVHFRDNLCDIITINRVIYGAMPIIAG